jgi:hypothetical protein
MGCDIHAQAERQIDGRWTVIEHLSPFDLRSYGLFAFLAGVRNYSAIPPLAAPRGIPADSPGEGEDGYLGDHSYSWLSLEELLAFDYDQPLEDRRSFGQIADNAWSGAITVEPGEGHATTYRAFLPEQFFIDLEAMKAAGAERVVFGFDS